MDIARYASVQGQYRMGWHPRSFTAETAIPLPNPNAIPVVTTEIRRAVIGIDRSVSVKSWAAPSTAIWRYCTPLQGIDVDGFLANGLGCFFYKVGARSRCRLRSHAYVD